MSPMEADTPPSWKRPALLLGLLTCLFCLPLLWRALAVVQLDANEGWNVVRAVMALHHMPLYGGRPVLDLTNYPFLSFHFIAGLMALGADPLFAGRAVALVSLLALGGFAGATARLLTPVRHAPLFAGLLFVLWLAIWMPNRVAVDDPQLLGMVLEAAGFYLFLRGGTSMPVLWFSAGLFALALFTKQNLLALPAGAGLALICQKRWRALLHWLIAGGLCVGLLLWLTLRLDGPYFFIQMLQPRAYLWRDAGAQGGDYLLVFLPVLCLAGAWCWRQRRQAQAWPLIFGWIIANLLGFFFEGGDGVGRNVFFEALILSAVLAMAACARAPRSLKTLLLLYPFLWALAHFHAALREDQALPGARAEFAAATSLLAPLPGPVMCENLLLCARAGHRSAFYSYFVLSEIRLHRLPDAEITAMVAQRQLQAVEIGTTDQPEPLRRAQFTPSFLAALKAHYRLALRGRTIAVWVPAP